MTPQTNTRYATPHAQETQTREKEPSLIDRLPVLVNHIARSEEYRMLRMKRVPHTLAFTTAIETILDSPDNGFNGLDTALLRTTSKLGTFMEAQEELSSLENARHTYGRLSDEDFSRTKALKHDYIIPFNHAIKSLIDKSPNVTIDHLTSALTRTYTAVYSRHNSLNPSEDKDPRSIIEPAEIMYRLKQTANGMRHEIAAETMLTAAGVEYDYETSVDDDAHGTDLIVYLDGIDGTPEAIDIKASPKGEEDAHKKYTGSRAVWTGLGREDFRGMKGTSENALSISYEVAQSRAESFVDHIRDIVSFSNEHKARMARSIGRSARH